MQKIKLHQDFVSDLLSHGDASFAKRIIKHLLEESIGTVNISNDHRYRDIPNAWIRYVSRGRTAYRIIYIRDSEGIMFYRCGSHSVEDRLEPPMSSSESGNELVLEFDNKDIESMTKPLSIVTNHKVPLIYSALMGRKLIPNKAVYLVSPFIDPDVVARGNRLGQVLDSIQRGGTEIIVITAAEKVGVYETLWKDLKNRNIELVFLPKLHSKVYLFVTDTSVAHETSKVPSLGIIGSSNLTKPGIATEPTKGNMESNYTVHESSIDQLEKLVIEYYFKSMDYLSAKKALRK